MKRSSSGIPVPSVLRQRNQSDTPVLNRLSVAKHGHESNQKNKLQQNVKRKRSSAELLSRVSLATGRSTPNKFVTPNQNRLLAVPSAQFSRNSIDTMRSSFGGKPGSTSWQMTEPFKTALIDKVLGFFVNYQGELTVNRKMMRSPSKNEFIEIFSFIYGYMCPGYKMASSRLEDEIPKVLKKLKYPVQIQKSSFKTVGTPHTWPSILAMLGWLIDQIALCDNFFDPSEVAYPKDFEEEINFSEIKFNSLVNFFKTGDDERKLEENLMDFRKILENEEKITYEEFHHHEQELMEIKLKLESMEVQDHLQSYLEKLTELCEDQKKIWSYNEEMKEHIGVKDRERAQIDSNLEELKEQNEQIKEQINMLEELKSNQKFSNAELNMYKNQKHDLAVQINHYDMEKKNLNDQIDSLQMSEGKIQMRLSELSIQFNNLAEKQQLPLEGISICSLEEQIQYWKTDVVEAIKSEKAKVKDENFANRNCFEESKAKLGKVQELLNNTECKKHKLECKQKRLQEEIEFLRREKGELEKSLTAELESLGDQISQERMVSKMSLPQLQSRLEESEKELEEKKKRDREYRQKNKDIVEQLRLELRGALELRNKNLETLNQSLSSIGVEMVTKFKSIIEAVEEL